MVIARSWRAERIGSYCLMGTEFQLGKMKKFWRWLVVYNNVNVLNATELPLKNG